MWPNTRIKPIRESRFGLNHLLGFGYTFRQTGRPTHFADLPAGYIAPLVVNVEIKMRVDAKQEKAELFPVFCQLFSQLNSERNDLIEQLFKLKSIKKEHAR